MKAAITRGPQKREKPDMRSNRGGEILPTASRS